MLKNAVTGLVLSMGEPTTKNAIEALRNQTHVCVDVQIVTNISPFHKAINKGVAEIETEFFLQCDADMIPDPDCVDILLKHMQDDIGVVIGYLQDPLMGKIQAIKLFRTSCAKTLQFDNHLSPDTDLINRMNQLGWRYVFANREVSRQGRSDDIFGDHCPQYTDLYTFQKFRLEGARMAKRGVFRELEDSLDRLSQSRHPMAKIAIIGLCNRIFEDRKVDGLGPYVGDELFEKLHTYQVKTSEKNHIFAPIA
ncbi:MAG: hypothetical protein ACI9VI_003305 [Candidatus Azotimanducaceae bacterium]|jgi:hypothetical protein